MRVMWWVLAIVPGAPGSVDCSWVLWLNIFTEIQFWKNKNLPKWQKYVLKNSYVHHKRPAFDYWRSNSEAVPVTSYCDDTKYFCVCALDIRLKTSAMSIQRPRPHGSNLRPTLIRHWLHRFHKWVGQNRQNRQNPIKQTKIYYKNRNIMFTQL